MPCAFRAFGAAGLVTAALLLSASPAAACSCIVSGPPCQAYFSADAVFVGTVDAIEIHKRPLEGMPDRRYDRKLVHMTVDGVARGVQGTRVDVWTGMGGGDCGFDFKVGQRYVVYASRHSTGELGTGICSRTRLASDPRAAEDLAYLSALPASGAGARVFGMVSRREQDPATGSGIDQPLANVQVLVQGPAGVFSGTTGEDGRYAIAGVPPGKYETEVLPPSEFSRRFPYATFEVKDPRACQVQDFVLVYAGRVSGVVLDAAGHPAAGVRVEIAPASTPDRPMLAERAGAATDANGLFELSEIQPGSYVVGVGLTLQLDQPVVYARSTFRGPVEVGQGNRVDIGTLRLPEPSRRHQLKGIAVDADGAPIAGANVVLFSGEYRQATMPVKTAADGTFTLPVFDGQAYTIRAYVNLATSPIRQAQATESISVRGEPPPIRLVLVVR